MGKHYIAHTVTIKNNVIYKNGDMVFSLNKSEPFTVFAKAAYKNGGLAYGKFYKMDALSKLGFLAAEYLLQNTDRRNILPEQIAVVLLNKSASLPTDKNYQALLETNIPSPAVFVYTLPNIVIGELCIRHDIKGETLFLIRDEFEPDFVFDLVNCQLENSDTKWCITGWVEMNMEDRYNANLFLISEEKAALEFNKQNLI